MRREKECGAVMYYPQYGDIMPAFAVLLHNYPSSYLCRPIITSANSQHLRPKSVNFVAHFASFATSVNYLRSRPRPHCSTADSNDLGDDNSDDHDSPDSVQRDGVITEIEKLGNNTRRIRSRVAIDANLETIWSILTDYERLSDFIPGLALSKLIEKSDNVVRLYQIGMQNLPLGLKFNAKAVLDCYEKDVEICEFGKRRDIEFKMTEGDFHLFQGKWSIEQLDKAGSEESDYSLDQEFRTILWYFVDVKPKMWLPVHLVEGILCKEIKINLLSIREEARKMSHNALKSEELI